MTDDEVTAAARLLEAARALVRASDACKIALPEFFVGGSARADARWCYYHAQRLIGNDNMGMTSFEVWLQEGMRCPND